MADSVHHRPVVWTKESLLELVQNKLSNYKFILVSNREPYVHRRVRGKLEFTQPASGLTLALDPIMRACGGTWIAHGSGDADWDTADEQGRLAVPPDNPFYTLRRVRLDPSLEQRYYYGLSNQALWPLCHVVFTRPVFRPEDWEAYREVNRIFADAVLEEANGEPVFVFIQDFHFALLPRMLKERNPSLVTAQFWHIPWPNPEIFRTFPWKEELLDGMLGNDLLGFHLRFHCQNFLDTVDRVLEARVDRERSEITRAGRTTTVRAFPISIDFERHAADADAAVSDGELDRWRRELHLNGEILGIGIDRLDYTKGICERLRAIERFLESYPAYQQRFRFAQVAVPSRSRIPEYKHLERQVDRLASRINRKYRRWPGRSKGPILLLKRQYSQQRLSGLHRLARLCMVNSLHDGMNLVAKEFVASRTDEDGVLILSDFTGASRELTDAILVNPFSESEIVEALRQALEMTEDERRRRMRKMRSTVADSNIYRWAGKILSALLKFDLPSVEENAAPLPAAQSM